MGFRRNGPAVFAASLALLLLSCGTDSSPGDSTGQMISGSGGSAGSTPTTGGGAASGGSAAVDASIALDLSPADIACRATDGGGKLADPSECIRCCDSNHAGAYPVQAEQTRACVCKSPGICANICSTSYCVAQPVNMGTCYDCVFSMLSPGEECFQVALDACGTDASCAAYVGCRANCVR